MANNLCEALRHGDGVRPAQATDGAGRGGAALPHRRRRHLRVARLRQVLSLIHFSAQIEHFLSIKPPDVSHNDCSRQSETWMRVSPWLRVLINLWWARTRV